MRKTTVDGVCDSVFRAMSNEGSEPFYKSRGQYLVKEWEAEGCRHKTFAAYKYFDFCRRAYAAFVHVFENGSEITAEISDATGDCFAVVKVCYRAQIKTEISLGEGFDKSCIAEYRSFLALYTLAHEIDSYI